MREPAHKFGPPLIDDQQVINMELDSESQTDDEKAVHYDWGRRGSSD